MVVRFWVLESRFRGSGCRSLTRISMFEAAYAYREAHSGRDRGVAASGAFPV